MKYTPWLKLKETSHMWYTGATAVDASFLFKHECKLIFAMDYVQTDTSEYIMLHSIAVGAIRTKKEVLYFTVKDFYWYKAADQQQALRAAYMKWMLKQDIEINDTNTFYIASLDRVSRAKHKIRLARE